MSNIKSKIAIAIVLILLIAGGGAYKTYNSMLEPADRGGKTITFQVESGSSIVDLAEKLEKEGLIKNAFAFRINAKIGKYSNLKAGYYEVSSAMTTPELTAKIFSGKAVFPDTIVVTFPEGKALDEMAAILSEKTTTSAEDILKVWNSDEFVDSAIEKYWFVTEDVKKAGIKYPLNGYLFPDTYHFNSKNITPEEAGYKLLDQMDRVLAGYKSKIESSSLSIHEILTFASIVEYEARFDEDRPIVAGVFYNRLKVDMRLQSCATLQMALGVHKLVYTTNDLKVDSPYNTYMIDGLPIGPGNSPSEVSIAATLEPAEHEYYYFLSDVYGDNKTYYSKTLEEHNKKKAEILK
ncbi:MAG: endolytic transglycosylase MltG [Eubacteriaceae bacterium]|nr:endolytic transglycosylase MltG [Eubacteriaceae bacterium]